MKRSVFIEMCSRQIHGGFPSDDTQITNNLINTWIEPAAGYAAKTNYKDNIAIDGINYVNNSFYTTFSGISISSNGNFTWKLTLPNIPLGIGRNEGISLLQLNDSSGNQTRPLVPLSQNQRTYFQNIPPVPNLNLYYYEGKFAYIISTLLLNSYTAKVTLVSAGDPIDMDSELNVPSDYLPIMQEYIYKQLTIERNVPQDLQNDGNDAITTT